MTSLTDKVLKNIEQKNITPRPKWVFRAQDVAIWISSALFIMIGGVAFSVVIYMVKDSDWNIYQNMGNSIWGFMLLMLPYFWLIVLGILVAIANYNLKITKKGYRFRLRTMVIIVMVLSVVIGWVLYCAGLGREIDEAFADRVPFYEKFVNKMNRDRKLWMNPDRGLLAGMIVSVSNDGKVLVSDFNNDIWRVVSDEKTVLQGRALGEKQAIKIVGQSVIDDKSLLNGEKTFVAKIIQVIPDQAFLKRHPMGPPRKIEMDSGVQRYNPNSNSFMHMEYNDEATTSPVGQCMEDKDCQLPFQFAIRSNCAFGVKCLNNVCQVTCEIPKKGNIETCLNVTDCGCDSYVVTDKVDCICNNGACLVIVR